MKKILVTGVSGFIGSSLYRFLKKQRKYDVYGIDQTLKVKGPNLFQCNILAKSKLKEILLDNKFDVIFHCAGGRSSDKTELYKSNVASTKALLGLIFDLKLTKIRIVIPGSAAEYGRIKNIAKVKETYHAIPLSEYGKSKLKQVQLALSYVNEGLDVSIGRIFNILGENTPEALVAGSMAKQINAIKKNQNGRLYFNDLKSKRDFLDISDVCSALLAIALKGKRGEVYNICSEEATAIETLLKEFIAAAKIKTYPTIEKKKSCFKSFDVIGSNNKLRRETGWRRIVSLRNGIKNTLKSYS